MRILIVDDEPIARRVLREELELLDDVEIIGEAENGETAIELISSRRPDVVFVDLQMPMMTGFEMIEQLHHIPVPAVVIVTAYDQHAIHAFEAGAIDYLLKPVSQTRLAQAMERVRRLITNPLRAAEQVVKLQEIAPLSSAGARIRKVVGRIREEYFLLDIQEVLAFQAEGELTWIITAKQRYLATQSLKAIENRLQNTAFCRIHRNALVNANHIRKMSMLSSQRWLMTLTNGQEFVVSKRQAKHVRPFLTW